MSEESLGFHLDCNVVIEHTIVALLAPSSLREPTESYKLYFDRLFPTIHQIALPKCADLSHCELGDLLFMPIAPTTIWMLQVFSECSLIPLMLDCAESNGFE